MVVLDPRNGSEMVFRNGVGNGLYIRLGMNFYLVAIWYSLILLFRNGRPLLEQRENKGILYFYYSETVVLYSRKERIKEFFIFTIQKRSAIL